MTAMNTPLPSTAPHQQTWFKSSFSSNANACVEVRFDGAHVSIRDSKFRRNLTHIIAREPIIQITRDEWATLLNELTGSAAPGANGAVLIESNTDATTTLRTADGKTALTFTETEWQSYLAGVHAGEFQPAALSTSSR